MNIRILKLLVSVMCGLSFSWKAFAGGTVVGNGGDPIFEFMEAARASMIETLKLIATDPQEQALFCDQTTLTPEQIQFCREYFMTVLPDILRLSQGANKTLFVLREQPLLVRGPDGQPMVVAARTELGPLGPIELNRDAVKTMLPTQVLFLLTHEFQHKSDFHSAFVNDNDPVGPFANGRDLIDNAAKSVVAIARRTGKIGFQFGIRDIFDCIVVAGSAKFGARLSSSRLFLAADLFSYETSLGQNTSVESIFLPETIDTAVVFKFRITEPNNCGDPHPFRKTSVQIVRRSKISNRSFQDTVLSEVELPYNPMCPQSDAKIELTWQQTTFSCQYFGSQGSSSSIFSNRRVPTLKGISNAAIPRPL